jgi:hypothetical protein
MVLLLYHLFFHSSFVFVSAFCLLAILLYYLMAEILPSGVCFSVLFVVVYGMGIRQPLLIHPFSVTVLIARVLKSFLSKTFILPLLAAMCDPSYSIN